MDAVRRIVLVRHGHYERVGDLGDTVWALSPLGRRQAARTGRRLVRLLSIYPGKLEGVFASPWPRALQTAEIAAHELGIDTVRVKPYLHEVVPLVLTDDSGRSMHPDLPPSSDRDRAAAVDQIERCLARFWKPARTDTTALVFAHGNLIRYLIATTLGLPFESWMRMDSCHGAISEVRIFSNGQPALIYYNDTGHLPPSMVSS